jgi:hypothetical protein
MKYRGGAVDFGDEIEQPGGMIRGNEIGEMERRSRALTRSKRRVI